MVSRHLNWFFRGLKVAVTNILLSGDIGQC